MESFQEEQVIQSKTGQLLDTEQEEEGLQSLMGIVQAYQTDDEVFFVTTLVVGVICTLLLLSLIVQLCKVPTNDFFVLKGGIYLCIALTIRVTSCFYIYYDFRRY